MRVTRTVAFLQRGNTASMSAMAGRAFAPPVSEALTTPGPSGAYSAARSGFDFGRISITPQAPGLQAKLVVGPVDDPHEREADAVADQVLRTADSIAPVSSGSVALQRKCEACASRDDEEPLRRKSHETNAVGHEQSAAPPIVHDVLRSSGRPLDPETRAFMEPRFGHDFSKVKVHADAEAARSARSVGALAYAVGSDVVFAAGEYVPHTPAGQRLLAHELTHVVQQGSADAVGLSTNRARRAIAATSQQSVPPRVLQRTASPADEKGKADAQKQHEEQQRHVATLLAKPPAANPARGTSDPENLYHNTIEWITGGKIDLVVLSPIHDSTTRRTGLRGYFDPRILHPAVGGDYPADPAVQTDDGIDYESLGISGTTYLNRVKIMTDNILISEEDFQRTLIHEGQHVADRVGGKSVLRMGLTTPGREAELSYQTEFRGYWVQPGKPPPPPVAAGGGLMLGGGGPYVPPGIEFGSPDKPAKNNVPVTAENPALCPACSAQSGAVSPQQSPALKQSAPLSRKTSFKNEKQENIAQHIFAYYKGGNYPCWYVCEPAFRDTVDNFSVPTGVNLVNSMRIERLNAAIDAVKPTMQEWDMEVQTLLRAARQLDSLDRKFLQDPKAAEPFWDHLKANLSAALFASVKEVIETGTILQGGDYPMPTPDKRVA